MPLLQQRKNDGGYYITTSFQGSFVTYQVSREGVRELAKYGIADGNDVPQYLLRQLRDGLLIFTGGAGAAPFSEIPYTDSSPHKQGARLLSFENRDEKWGLSVALPELPLAVVSNAGSALESCTITMSEAIVSAFRLWPGGGGYRCPVAPQTEDYSFEVSAWPNTETLPAWLEGMRGLAVSGTLFAGPSDDGLRIGSYARIVPGETYYLVAHAAKLHAPIPVAVPHQSLGMRGEWTAWEIGVPLSVTPEVENWFSVLGYHIGAPLVRLTILSPPPIRYSINHIPVYEASGSAVLALHIPREHRWRAKDTLFIMRNDQVVAQIADLATGSSAITGPCSDTIRCFQLALRTAGHYLVAATNRDVSPFGFDVADDSSIFYPVKPLTVTFGDETFSAFGTGVHRRSLTDANDIRVRAVCPVPLTLSWSCDSKHANHRRLNADEATEHLVAAMHACLDMNAISAVRIESGAFGTLDIEFVPPEHESSADNAMWSPKIFAAARDLAASTPSLLARRGHTTVPLSRNLRSALLQLQALPGGARFIRITRVPPEALPKIQRVARLLEQSENTPVTRSRDQTSGD